MNGGWVRPRNRGGSSPRPPPQKAYLLLADGQTPAQQALPIRGTTRVPAESGAGLHGLGTPPRLTTDLG